ncbi:MAG: RusA family crossover junction endodeoxyribonuclease [Nitrososphaera sp.]
MDILFTVNNKPPYKQSPADRTERINQAKYKESLIAEARNHLAEPAAGPLKMEIDVRRYRAAMDGANIIGGIADTLQDIAYSNDRQLVEIRYLERKATADSYTVRILSVNNARELS